MDLLTIKDLYVGSTPVQSAWLGGTKVWERKSPVDIQSVFDAMVLWYDPKRQGATNESMKANPKLIDLSGNGHDATCYNFAWAGKSGIGSYVTNFGPRSSEKDVTILGTQKFRVNTIIHGQPVLAAVKSFTGFNKTVTIKIEGLTDNQNDELDIRVTNSEIITYLHNGENVVDFGEATVSEGFIVFNFNNKSLTNVIIEILPEYPNALVADGVDDYAKVEGLPLLDDYTVIIKRDFINIDANGVTAVKGETGSDTTNFAFGIDILNNSTGYIYGSFGTYAFVKNSIIKDKIIIATPNNINGISVAKGDSEDVYPYLYLCGEISHSRYNNIALYSFILFDRTLTEEEINWVKDNLIEGTYKNPEALLIDAWVFSGHTNEEAPTKITGEKGTVLNCYNFAWNEEGSGFKDGYLCFDGVNDRLSTYKHLPLLKTVIAKYVIPKQTYNHYSSLMSFADVPNRNVTLNYYDDGISKTSLSSIMSGYGILTYDIAQDEVHTDYLNTYGRNGEPYTKTDTTEMEDTYQITMGCIHNNIAYMQAKIAYVAIYSESLTDAECMMEIKRLNALWESKKQ